MAIKMGSTSADIDFSKLFTKETNPRNYYRAFAEKGNGKTSLTAKLRKNEGTKHMYLSADENTNPGLFKYFLETGGMDGKPIPGVDPKDAAKTKGAIIDYLAQHFIVADTAKLYSKLRLESTPIAAKWAKACFAAGLKRIEAGEVASVFVHHYGTLVRLGEDLSRHEASIPRGGKISAYKYGPRTELLGEIDAHILEYVRLADEGACDSVWIVDYGAEPKIVETTNDEGEAELSEERVMPRWARSEKATSFLQNNTVWFDVKRVTRTEEAGDGHRSKPATYTAEVVDSQHPMFKSGTIKDITGRGIDVMFGPWWDEVLARRKVA